MFISSNYKLPFERLNGIRRDTHSRGSRHDDDGDDSRDSHRGDNEINAQTNTDAPKISLNCY